MAVINHYELHPNIGAVWQRVCALYATYAPDDTLTWSYVFNYQLIGSSNNQDIEITIDNGTDQNVYFLILADLYLGDLLPIVYVSSRPGWYAMPAALPRVSGSRTILTDAITTLLPIREGVWTNFTRGSLHHQGSFTQSYDLTNAKTCVWHRIVGSGQQVVADWHSVSVEDIAGTITWASGVPQSTGDPDGVIVASGGGGGSTDMTGVVAALEDIATREMDYSANQGGDVWSMYGKVRAT
jgi:hypothetical protein